MPRPGCPRQRLLRLTSQLRAAIPSPAAAESSADPHPPPPPHPTSAPPEAQQTHPASAPPEAQRAHFHEHGWLVVRGALDVATEIDPVRHAIDVRLNMQAQRWLDDGAISSTHGAAPFNRRMAAVAEQLPDALFGDATGSDEERAEGTLAGWARAMDTMSSRMPEMFDLFFAPALLDAVGLLLGDELTLSPIQHLRPYIRAREGRQPWMLHEWQCALTDMPPPPSRPPPRSG